MDLYLKILTVVSLLSLSALSAPVKNETSIHILASGETHAMLLPCDCPVNPGGGLAKRAHIVSTLRDSGALLLLDAGGFSGGGMYDSYTEGRRADSLRTLTSMRAMAAMGYDAAAIGDDDLQYGAAWLAQAARQVKLTLVSANCLFANGKPVAVPYILVKKGKWTFAITGLTTQEQFASASDSVRISPPVQALRGIWPEMVKKSDYRIVLSHLGEEQSKAILDSFPECNVVVNGHRKIGTDAVFIQNGRLFMQFGFAGKSLSHALVNPAKGGLSVSASEWIAITPDVPDDPAIAAIVNAPSPGAPGLAAPQAAVLDLYIMSRCPYGLKALKGFIEAIPNFPGVEPHVWFIGSQRPDGTLESLHGDKEAADEMLWLAVEANYPAKWRAFIADRASSDLPSDSAAKKLGMNLALLKQWIGDKGKNELLSHYLRSQRIGITASPTLLLNNASVDVEITKPRLGKVLCDKLPKSSAYCDSVPECIDNSDCRKKGKVGTCVGEKTAARCVFKDAVRFTFTVLTHDSILTRPQQEIIATTNELFEGAVIETLTVASPRGKELLGRFAPRALPLYLFDTKVAGADNFDKIESGVERSGDHYTFKEGFVKKAYFYKRKLEPGGCDVYIDPVFAGAKDALAIALAKRTGRQPRIFPLLSATPETDSVSGEDRLNREEAQRWVVLSSKYPASYRRYLESSMKSKEASYWFLSLKDLGIGVEAFVKNIRNDTGALLQVWRQQTELGISGPVEIVLNNREVVRIKSPKELGELLDLAASR